MDLDFWNLHVKCNGLSKTFLLSSLSVATRKIETIPAQKQMCQSLFFSSPNGKYETHFDHQG